jgi:hypothetical protein
MTIADQFRADGYSKGKQETKIQITRNLFQSNIPTKQIAHLTGLPIKKVLEFKRTKKV